MMHREDYRFRRDYHQMLDHYGYLSNGKITSLGDDDEVDVAVSDLNSAPLISVGEFQYKAMLSDLLNIDEQKDYDARRFLDCDWFPGDHFLYRFVRYAEAVNDVEHDFYAYVRRYLSDDGEYCTYAVIDFYLHLESNDKGYKAVPMMRMFISRELDDDTVYKVLEPYKKMIEYQHMTSRLGAEEHIEQNHETMHEVMRSFIGQVLALSDWLNEFDSYPVIVQPKPEKKKKGQKLIRTDKKRPWNRKDLRRVVFLNRLPEEISPTGRYKYPEGKGAPHKPHQRRAHTKTLKHPRYRNHPKYLVKDGIKVKPAWIGPKTRDYEGNTYTVWLPPKSASYGEAE